jgi:carboxylesterase type B
MYDGRELSTKQNVIIITVNYRYFLFVKKKRLGVFGFIYTNELFNQDKTSGLYGLQDQTMGKIII